VDIDEVAVKVAKENLELNKVDNVRVFKGVLDDIEKEKRDNCCCQYYCQCYYGHIIKSAVLFEKRRAFLLRRELSKKESRKCWTSV